MEFLYTTEISVPLSHLVLLLFLSTVALLFGKVKLALLTNYLFTMYWGYYFNRDLLLSYMDKGGHFILIYFGLGLLIVLVAMLGFLTHRG